MFFVDNNAGFDCLTYETVINSYNMFVSDCLIDIDVTFDVTGNFQSVEIRVDFVKVCEVI
jgi:hypothetical protein